MDALSTLYHKTRENAIGREKLFVENTAMWIKAPRRCFGALRMLFLLLVFLFGRLAAAQVALVLVFVKNDLHLLIKQRIDALERGCDVLVDGAFADLELLCRCAHRCAVLRKIPAEYDTSLFTRRNIHHFALLTPFIAVRY